MDILGRGQNSKTRQLIDGDFMDSVEKANREEMTSRKNP